MAPLPQATSSSTPSQPQQRSQTVLPGMKRGIAIGVAASVCLILIALLAVFAISRRRKIKARQLQAHASSLNNEKEWAEEKKKPPVHDERWSSPPAPLVEADTRTIYELDASPVPELPTKDEGRKAEELDTECAQQDPQTRERSTMGSEKTIESATAEETVGRNTPRRQVPVLHISPPELAPIERISLLGVSPLGVSPLEEVYFPQTPRSSHGWV